MKTRKADLNIEAGPPEGNCTALDSVQMQVKLRQEYPEGPSQQDGPNQGWSSVQEAGKPQHPVGER